VAWHTFAAVFERAVMNSQRNIIVNSRMKLVIALVISTTLVAAAAQGLHAQGKPKAYQVSESEIIDAAALASYIPLVQAAQKAAGGRSFRTTGTIVGNVGTAPKRVSISEWDSLEQAQAWESSDARKNLAPQRDKAIKIVRQYIVQAAN
jgi:uncharacterized protein (DUF1330 family)